MQNDYKYDIYRNNQDKSSKNIHFLKIGNKKPKNTIVKWTRAKDIQLQVKQGTAQ